MNETKQAQTVSNETETFLSKRKERDNQSAVRREFEKARLTGKEVALIDEVRKAKEAPTCEDVAHVLGVSTNRIAGAVSVLIAKGWLATERVKRNGTKRRVLILTDKGKATATVTKSGKFKADGAENPNLY